MTGLVLIADGDSQRGGAIAEACAERSIEHRVTTHGAAALEVALAELPTVLVAQIDLPLIDGVKLAAILRANPRTRGLGVLYLGDRPTDSERVDLEGEVIGAPVDPDAVARCLQALLARSDQVRAGRRETAAGGVEGQLAQLPLADLLELFHVSRKTGIVGLSRRDARNRSEKGVVFLRGGDVVQARAGRVEGEKALYRLLAWDRGSFSFQPDAVEVTPAIQTPTRVLLREGLRQLAEWERAALELPPRDARVSLKVARHSLPNVIHPLTQEVLLVLELSSRVQEVVDRCSFPDYQVLRTLQTLVHRGLVELEPDRQPAERHVDTGLFSPAHAARLREWLDVSRPRGTAPRDAKLLLVASDESVGHDFARLLQRLPGVDLEPDAAAMPADALLPLGRLLLDDDFGIELVQLPASDPFAPLWPVAGYEALGTLLLLRGPVTAAVERVARVAETLRSQPRARIFHLLLLDKHDRVTPEALQENLSVFDEASLFLIPLDQPEKAAILLREMFARILP